MVENITQNSALKNVLPLDPMVVDHIAAGEVVEKPASVVKELVENALDAGATSIKVVVEEGGQALIEVEDNGTGIASFEHLFKRHATSKITCLDDLYGVGTMGFRGEALSSIAAVSKVDLQTRTPEGPAHRILIEGGVKQFDGPFEAHLAHPTGTKIRVTSLFYNVPARKRFQKSVNSDLRAIQKTMVAFALSSPGVAFAFWNGAKCEWTVRAEDDLKKRTNQLLGLKNAIPLNDQEGFVKIEGLLSPPGVEKSTAEKIFIFVNHRWIEDRTLRFALLRGYRTHLLKSRFPVVCLHLELDPSLLDVNCHPRKMEVKLQYEKEITNQIATAVREHLRKAEWTERPGAEPESDAQPWPPRQPAHFSELRSPPPIPYFASSPSSGARDKAPISYSAVRSPIRGAVMTPAVEGNRVDADERAAPAPSSSAFDLLEAEYIGVFGGCFLFFEWKKRLVCCDQHALHERILFEKLTQEYQTSLLTQKILFDTPLSFDQHEIEALTAERETLKKLGFTFSVKGRELFLEEVPVVLMRFAKKANFRDIFQKSIDKLLQEHDESREEMLEDILATMACRAAVKAGDLLDPNQLAELIHESEEVDFYHNCPHGRPVFKEFSMSDVHQWFERT